MNRIVVVLHHGDPGATALDPVARARLRHARSLGGTLIATHPDMGGPLGPCTSTRYEALAVAAHLLPQSPAITLVTSASHIPRARRVFERVGFAVTPAAATNVPGSPMFEWLYECAAIAMYRLKGWI
jgi:hypothetical protein